MKIKNKKFEIWNLKFKNSKCKNESVKKGNLKNFKYKFEN